MEKKRKKLLQLFVIFILVFIGGYINVISLLSNHKFSTSHLTGNISKLTEAYYLNEFLKFKEYIYIIGSFLIGSITSGYFVGGNEFKFKKKYGYMLLAKSFLLLLATFFLQQGLFLGLIVTSYVCGMQNALIIKFNGALVRTTHLTGTITDLGVNLGNYIRTKYLDLWRLILNLILIFGFFIGGFSAMIAFPLYREGSLKIAVGLYFLMGVSYEIFKYIDMKNSRESKH